ncbi:PepSY domain-containing protein [Oceanobacillus bengalensis]|uniref:Peptidase M4 n=1 Tax=Oceanobacillus bengalensis TaxID=1435466 RepID=A0A494YXF1_9BACI|nr:PepSY domain-containing protein [Oceanobacillus bengalensis]RKQ14902.1 peptidase M4 [Oceanobacillus bengalensis]
MSKRNVLLAFALGATIGYIANQQVQTYQKVSPEKALKRAKEIFKKTGPISGSWIYMKAEEIEKDGLLFNAYRGGITRTIDGENKQYEFCIDAETGGIIYSEETV